jgi:hypothetical protein
LLSIIILNISYFSQNLAVGALQTLMVMYNKGRKA